MRRPGTRKAPSEERPGPCGVPGSIRAEVVARGPLHQAGSVGAPVQAASADRAPDLSAGALAAARGPHDRPEGPQRRLGRDPAAPRRVLAVEPGVVERVRRGRVARGPAVPEHRADAEAAPRVAPGARACGASTPAAARARACARPAAGACRRAGSRPRSTLDRRARVPVTPHDPPHEGDDPDDVARTRRIGVQRDRVEEPVRARRGRGSAGSPSSARQAGQDDAGTGIGRWIAGSPRAAAARSRAGRAGRRPRTGSAPSRPVAPHRLVPDLPAADRPPGQRAVLAPERAAVAVAVHERGGVGRESSGSSAAATTARPGRDGSTPATGRGWAGW